MGNKQIVVVGAGVVGLATAHELACRGWDVVVLDRGAERRDGCSFGNAGMIVPSHFVPLAAPGMVWLGIKWMFDETSREQIFTNIEILDDVVQQQSMTEKIMSELGHS